MALKTNSKKASERLMKYIRDYSMDELTGNYGIPEPELENDEIICFCLYDIFKEEKLKNDLRYKSGKVDEYTLFRDWAQGLAMGGLFCYWYNRYAKDDLGEILEESETEKAKYTEEQACECLTSLIYREIIRRKERATK